MKKNLLLLLFAIAAFVSQAQAQNCTSEGGTVTWFCSWDGDGSNCHKLAPEPTCAEKAASCLAAQSTGGLRSTPTSNVGTITGTNCSSLTAVTSAPTFDILGNLGEGECKGGGTKQLFCHQPTQGCLKLHTWYSSIGAPATCGPPSSPPVATDPPICTCAQLIANCPAGKLYVDVGTSVPDNGGGTGNAGKCETYGGVLADGQSSPSSASSGGSSSSRNQTVISYKEVSITGLNVVHFARNLQIASGKDATVSLFDMHGKQVLSQKVFSGITTISLEKQRQGVYYAIVRSGSQKQTVKVILK